MSSPPTLKCEEPLYLYVRAAVTLFDELLFRAFKHRLADHLPGRVLPISTEAPPDFLTLVDSEFANIARLLEPGRRQRDSARARIRALLALEAHVEENTRVSDSDVSRVEKGIRAGKTRDQVFPRLSQVGADVSGDGINVAVRFVKTSGLPVRFIGADEPVEAAAIREVDLQKKFHWSASKLAAKLSLTTLRARALRDHLGIDAEPDCSHTFEFGSQKIQRYSDNALTKMREAIEQQDLVAIWESHGTVRRNRPRPPCTQPGCVKAQAKPAS